MIALRWKPYREIFCADLHHRSLPINRISDIDTKEGSRRKESGAGLFKWSAGPWLRYELARGAVHDKWVVVSGSLPSHHYLLSRHILWPSGCQQTRGNVCAVFIKKAAVDIISERERVVDCRERRKEFQVVHKQTISEYDLGLAMGRSVMRCICGMCFA